MTIVKLWQASRKAYRKYQSLPNVIINGDFNSSDIEWGDLQALQEPNTQSYNLLLEILGEFGLQNTVSKINRLESNHVLALVLTFNPAMIYDVTVLPGMSDHNGVAFNVNLKPVRYTKLPHKVFKYKSAAGKI